MEARDSGAGEFGRLQKAISRVRSDLSTVARMHGFCYLSRTLLRRPAGMLPETAAATGIGQGRQTELE